MLALPHMHKVHALQLGAPGNSPRVLLCCSSTLFCPPPRRRAQELEADEAAARALAGAGVPPAQWAAGLSLLTEDARAPEWRLEEQAPVSMGTWLGSFIVG